ncbi:MAG TPA: hypothetical protein PKA33_08835 [Amaricoccus sp.]|uniref:hypothetical protein n=1 Tax=Amaricoccus sp. TaxID=1872485 RepID=UPI002B9686BD|nr:hypothetical protein [Amaricoccus sp.]HMQ92723.1 hypothetical protein [Amaricoccus sp.]HMR52534.1 hypothetical protein [Amaricoccus sp.]HMR60536.1 hypothetical protein [Amaricoccus sp.]HMT99455.1 hypothetical protein [Amaricoccus sp.]
MPSRPLRPVLAAVLALAAGAGGCAPPEAAYTPSEAVRGAPPPELLPNARFGAAFESGGGAAEDLEAGAEDLAERAAALQARAEALSAPVIDPDERARLESAAAAEPGR